MKGCTERPIIDGPFNNLLPWDYSRIPQVIGYGKGFVIESEEDLTEPCLNLKKSMIERLCLLDVRLDKHDGYATLRRITDCLSQ